MTPIRLLLVDDQRLFREGLRTLLSTFPEVEVIAEASDGVEAVALAAEMRPQVVLMDLRMPNLGGVEATRRILTADPGLRILVLTTFDDDDDVFEGLRAGAAGYLLKDTSPEKLIEAITAVARGESYLQPSITSKVLAELSRLAPGASPAQAATALPEPLSERELQVLAELVAGRSNREIARRLHLAEGTVKNHMTQILAKLQVSDRTGAALRARELGLV